MLRAPFREAFYSLEEGTWSILFVLQFATLADVSEGKIGRWVTLRIREKAEAVRVGGDSSIPEGNWLEDCRYYDPPLHRILGRWMEPHWCWDGEVGNGRVHWTLDIGALSLYKDSYVQT